MRKRTLTAADLIESDRLHGKMAEIHARNEARIAAIYAGGVFASCVPCRGEGCERCGFCGTVQVIGDATEFTVEGLTIDDQFSLLTINPPIATYVAAKVQS